MRRPLYAWAAVLSLLAVVATPQPAAAKSLLESIFGFLGSTPQPQPPKILSRPRPAYEPGARPGGVRSSNPFEKIERGQQSRPASSDGRYKTVCVRLCDGYFFPISQSSRRRDFYNDAQQCQSRCDSETRLYYTSPNAASINGARDLHGFTYEKLKTAFLYRKTLQKGCVCRPDPWSVAERMRHKTYALVAHDQETGVAEADQGGGDSDTIVPAKPNMVGEGATLEPAPMLIAAPAPVASMRPSAPRPAERRPPAFEKKSWGLGAAIGSGLPVVRYKHRWDNDRN